MAQGNFSLRFATVQEQGRFFADIGAVLEWPGSGTGEQDSGSLPEAIRGLTTALADTDRGFKQLAAVLESIKGALATQRSLLMTLNDRQQSSATEQSAAGEAKASILDNQPFSYLKPAIGLETAMAELGRALPLSDDQHKQMVQQNLKLATEPLVAPTGARAEDLVRVEVAAAKAGVARDPVNSAGTLDPQTSLLNFARDTALVGAGLDLQVKQAGEMLLGWRSSMNLDREQRLNLANATQYLGSELGVSAVDIGSILGRYGGDVAAAGLTPEGAAAVVAALLKSGADQASAGVAFAQFAQALAQGGGAVDGSRAAWSGLGVAPVDLQQALALMSEPSQYSSQEPGTRGAIVQSAEAAAQTPQARFNRLDAQYDGLQAAAGIAVLPDLAGSMSAVGAAMDQLSELAQEFPKETSALVLSAAALMAAIKVKGFYADVVDLFSGLGRTVQGVAGRIGPVLASLVSGIRAAAASAATRLATTLPGLASRTAGIAANAAMRLGAALSGLASRIASTTRIAAVRLGTALADLASRVAGMGRVVGARIRSTAGRVAKRSVTTGASGKPPRRSGGLGKGLGRKLLRPLMLYEAGVDAVDGWRDGDASKAGAALGSVGGGLMGGYAGAAAGAAIGTFIFPGIGTAIGGLIGGAVGSLAGGETGAWLGEKLGHQVDQLASPETVSQELTGVQEDNRQINFAPVVQIYGQDQASAQQLADRVVQQLQAQWAPMMLNDSLAVRRGAALTDGVV